jgi:tetratricopeptide (TPR) repeat protein
MAGVWHKKVIYLAIGLVAGAGLGFFSANILSPARPATRPANAAAPADTLSLEEIRAAVAAADAKPDDLAMQRKLGLGLYEYSRPTPDAPYLPDVARLLKRAAANKGDTEVTLALGNTYFALGQQGAVENFAQARACYQQLLARQPDDADLRTAMGLAYLFDKPARNAAAVAELKAALQRNPKQQNALQGMAAALIELRQTAEARKYIDNLASLHPQHPALAELNRRLAATP